MRRWPRRSRGHPRGRQELREAVQQLIRPDRLVGLVHFAPGGVPGSRAPRAGVRETCPWHASFLFGRRPQQPPRGTGNRPPPGSAGRREGTDTGHPNGVERRPGRDQRGAQRHDDRGGRSSVVRARARRAWCKRAGPARWERERAGGDDRKQAIGHLDRPHGRERKTTARTSSVTKRRRAAREAVRRSSSGRRGGYVMPTEGGMTRRSKRTRSGRYQRPPTAKPSGSPRRPATRMRSRSGSARSTARSRLIATAPMLPPGSSLVRIAGGPVGPRSSRPCANQPWTGQGTLASYCVTLTPRFANPF